MDMKKFCDMLIKDQSLHDIPITYIFRVAYAVFELINSGECYFYNDID